jgi:hypothetical protein
VALSYALGSTNASPISGIANVPGNAATVDVKTEIEVPYKVFCTPDWSSLCVLLSKKEGTFTLQFSTTAPYVGGTVQYTIIPIELKKAYQEDAKTITKLYDEWAILQRGKTLQKTEDDQYLNKWSDYHNRVVTVINDIEKEGCTPQTNNKLDALRNAP